MATLLNCVLQKSELLLPRTKPCFLEISRGAAKKTRSSTQNKGNCKAKHRTWKVSDGQLVHEGQILATQNWTRFHPGLNVVMGRNGTLNARFTGKVMVTCEEVKPNWNHRWVELNYADRKDQPIFKKYFNVIPEKQHGRFILKETN